ncbi:unnamed protein product [Phyllotreta striolata]|uniref:Uncharacterized protein n=1 Tax=Phyllotreta striolata TaxID=444603 RepID=A0A9N9TJX8_PHYSR|nr:unnamed protein product [Phyllotreta striolata]
MSHNVSEKCSYSENCIFIPNHFNYKTYHRYFLSNQFSHYPVTSILTVLRAAPYNKPIITVEVLLIFSAAQMEFKKNILLIFTLRLLFANALTVQESWVKFKNDFNKTYRNIVNEILDMEVFQENFKIIYQHNARYNAGLETYFMSINQFADVSPGEFSKQLVYKHNNQKYLQNKVETSFEEVNATVPAFVDWRLSGIVGNVQDQENCKSSWAFSAVGAIECQYAIKIKQNLDLSKQQLIDCIRQNCDSGGYLEQAFEFAKQRGLKLEPAYKYNAQRDVCKIPTGPYKIKNYTYVVPANEVALKNAVSIIGPISVTISAEALQFYGGGIFQTGNCHCPDCSTNHAVLVVGYGHDPQEYWVIKNSWGTTWGEKGYMRLARNVGECGIPGQALYPIL